AKSDRQHTSEGSFQTQISASHPRGHAQRILLFSASCRIILSGSYRIVWPLPAHTYAHHWPNRCCSVPPILSNEKEFALSATPASPLGELLFTFVVMADTHINQTEESSASPYPS